MKKIIAVLLSFVVVCGLFGCSSSDGSESTDNSSEENSEGTDENTIDTGETNEDTFLAPFDTSATIEETVLWDEKDVKITAMSLEYTNYSADLNVKIENNSDAALNFTAGTLGTPWNAVNGYMISDGYLNEDVEAGESVETSISFGTSELIIYGINKIADMQIGITAKSDSDSFFLSPQKIETTAAGSYDYATDTYLNALESGAYEQSYEVSTDYFATDTLYDSNGISIISEALLSQENEDGQEIELVVEMENQSEYNIYVELSDVSINDTLVYDYNWTQETLISGTKTLLTVDVLDLLDYSDDADESLISNGLDNMSFNMSIKNENYEEALPSETITISFD